MSNPMTTMPNSANSNVRAGALGCSAPLKDYTRALGHKRKKFSL
jgi:hypothetical protein